METADAQRLFQTAKEQFNQGAYNGALELLLRLNSEFPNSPDIIFALAQCYSKVGQVTSAMEQALLLRDKLQDPRGGKMVAAWSQHQSIAGSDPRFANFVCDHCGAPWSPPSEELRSIPNCASCSRPVVVSDDDDYEFSFVIEIFLEVMKKDWFPAKNNLIGGGDLLENPSRFIQRQFRSDCTTVAKAFEERESPSYTIALMLYDLINDVESANRCASKLGLLGLKRLPWSRPKRSVCRVCVESPGIGNCMVCEKVVCVNCGVEYAGNLACKPCYNLARSESRSKLRDLMR